MTRNIIMGLDIGTVHFAMNTLNIDTGESCKYLFNLLLHTDANGVVCQYTYREFDCESLCLKFLSLVDKIMHRVLWCGVENQLTGHMISIQYTMIAIMNERYGRNNSQFHAMVTYPNQSRAFFGIGSTQKEATAKGYKGKEGLYKLNKAKSIALVGLMLGPERIAALKASMPKHDDVCEAFLISIYVLHNYVDVMKSRSKEFHAVNQSLKPCYNYTTHYPITTSLPTMEQMNTIDLLRKDSVVKAKVPRKKKEKTLDPDAPLKVKVKAKPRVKKPRVWKKKFVI